MDEASAVREIRALIADRLEAMSTRDAARALATLAPEIVAFELAPPLALPPGAARDADALSAWFAGWAGPIDVEVRDLEIAASGDLGFCHSLNRLSGSRIDGRAVSLWMRSTLCLRKNGGAWKIVHAHSSVPFHMDGSYRAAVELAP